jgi:nucleoid-associated protein YgaU
MTSSGPPTPSSLKRTAVGLVALAALWNAVYWFWPVHREAPVVLASVPEAKPDAVQPPSTDEAEAIEAIDEGPIVLTMGGEEQAEQTPQIVDPMLLEDADGLGVRPPAFETYVATADDASLADIARRVYGDPSLAEAIKRANPMRDPRRLHAGQTWRIPLDPQNIQGVVVDASGNPVDPQAVQANLPYDTYTVRPGDTFGAISRRFYETTRHAEFIYEQNRERLGLRSIRSIRPGQVLHIPKEPK